MTHDHAHDPGHHDHADHPGHKSNAVGHDTVLHVHDLHVAFEQGPVLENICVQVHQGESLALIGPNGAGKSTFIRAVLGLVPPVSGTIEVLGTTPVGARRRVAYVPQAETLAKEFPVSAFQVALMGRYRAKGLGRRPSRPDREAALTALDRVGLADRARSRFGTLSGGQRQRVLLARAIAAEAELFLLDEPFNGVDGTTQQVLVDTLADLRRHGAAVIMSTHDLAMAHVACSEACLLNRHQVALGPVDQVLTADHLRSAYGHAATVLAADSAIVITGT